MENKKILVLYSTVDGSTQTYAEWIASVLSCDIMNYDNLTNKKMLAGYDILIYGACVRMGIVTQLDKLRKKIKKVNNLQLITFAVGMTRATVNNIKYLAKKNDIDVGDKFYYLKGEFNIMNRQRNFEVAMISRVIGVIRRSSAEPNSAEQYMIDCCERPHDWRYPANIKPIIEQINPELVSKVDEIEFTPNDYTDYIVDRTPPKVTYNYSIQRKK